MIYLKEAVLQNRKKIYDWLYFSDFSSFLNELQSSSQIPSPPEFKEDYEDFFFESSNPEKGQGYIIIINEDEEEEIGFISYTSFHLMNGIAELDIWLKSLNYTGKGYGTSALKNLSEKLFNEGFHTLIIRPCAKNIRAVNSYKKAGFVESVFEPEKYYKKEYIDKYAPGDCKDGEDIFMVLKNI
jgi:RimJ/RimL family protein N-acetyltransferase